MQVFMFIYKSEYGNSVVPLPQTIQYACKIEKKI